MYPCLQCLINCQLNEEIVLDINLKVQIIGIKIHDNGQKMYFISDGKNFCNSFFTSDSEELKIFQFIEIIKFRIEDVRINVTKPILFISEYKIDNTEKDCNELFCSPTIIDHFSHIDAYALPDFYAKQNLNIEGKIFKVISKKNNTLSLIDPDSKYYTCFLNNYIGIIEPMHFYLIQDYREKQNENGNGNDIISFQRNTIAIEKPEYDNFGFISKGLQDLINKSKIDLYNISAIIYEVGDLRHLGDNSFLRSILLTDKNGFVVTMELRDSYALSFKKQFKDQVLMAKCVVFTNKKICLIDASKLRVTDLSFSPVKEHLDWYQNSKKLIQNFVVIPPNNKINFDQIYRERLGESKKEFFTVEAQLVKIEIYGAFVSFNKDNYNKLIAKNNAKPYQRFCNNGGFIQSQNAFDNINTYEPKTDRSENYTLYYSICNDVNCKGHKNMRQLDNIGGKLVCSVCNREIDKPNYVFQFDMAFKDETRQIIFFRFKLFDQGIPQIIFNETAAQWKERSENAANEGHCNKKRAKRNLVQNLLNKWYRLDVETEREKDENGKYYEFPSLIIKKICPILKDDDLQD